MITPYSSTRILGLVDTHEPLCCCSRRDNGWLEREMSAPEGAFYASLTPIVRGKREFTMYGHQKRLTLC